MLRGHPCPRVEGTPQGSWGPGCQPVVLSLLPQVMGAPTPATAQARALWALLLATLGSAASQPLGGDPVCTARPLAKYSITFTGKWSQTAFPKQYPLFRPPAQWSSLLGKHSPAPAREAASPIAARAGGHSHPFASVQETRAGRLPGWAWALGAWWGHNG